MPTPVPPTPAPTIVAVPTGWQHGWRLSSRLVIVDVNRASSSQPWIALVDPSGKLRVAGHCGAWRGSVCEYSVGSALPGIRRLDNDFRAQGANVYLLGVPPLIWHDPVKLAIPAGQPASILARNTWCCADSE